MGEVRLLVFTIARSGSSCEWKNQEEAVPLPIDRHEPGFQKNTERKVPLSSITGARKNRLSTLNDAMRTGQRVLPIARYHARQAYRDYPRRGFKCAES
jgi:hypothetical protein